MTRPELYALLADLAARQAEAWAELAALEGATMGETVDTPPAPPKQPRRRGPRLPANVRPIEPARAARARRDLEAAGMLPSKD